MNLNRVRSVGYWLFTLVIAWEMAAGSIWDLERIEFVRGVFTHLGYPFYLLTIIGIWKLPCAVVLLVPRLPRLKEWAYAGAFFNYSGAAASHLFVGDRANQWAGPFVFALMTLAGWALRPAERRLASAPSEKTSAKAWAVTVGLVIAMFGVSFLTLPR